MINDKQSTNEVTCDVSCLAKLNITSTQGFTVTNLITGETLPEQNMLAPGISASVPGWGGSVYFRLDPK